MRSAQDGERAGWPGERTRRLLWFVGLYVAGVALTAAVAFLIKLALPSIR